MNKSDGFGVSEGCRFAAMCTAAVITPDKEQHKLSVQTEVCGFSRQRDNDASVCFLPSVSTDVLIQSARKLSGVFSLTFIFSFVLSVHDLHV